MPPSRPLVLTLLGPLLAGLITCPAAPAQDRPAPDLRVSGVRPGGGRLTVTGSWCRFDFDVRNTSDADRLIRVLVFYPSQPDVQYGRDAWVPARSILSTWVLV